MKKSKASAPYASSLLSLAQEKQQADTVLNDLHSISKTVNDSADLQALLANPVVKGDKKADILKAIFQGNVSDLSIDFLSLLAHKNRADLLLQVISTYQELYRTANNIVKLHIESAAHLDSNNIDAISKVLVPTGATVEVEQIINPDLIGGFIARVGDKQIDNSILSSLSRLKTEFQKKH